MKTRNLFGMLCVMLLALSMSSCMQPNHLRIMSYNVRNCLGMDSVLDYQRVADVILAANPDIVGIQELDSMTLRYPGKVALSELAERTGMYAVYAPTIDYRGGKYGHGILSKEKPIDWEIVPLISSSEPRVMLLVEFANYYFCNLHLSLQPKDRPESAEIIVDKLARLDKPVFLTGDFNAQPDDPAIAVFQENGVLLLSDPTQNTFPANRPRITIDYIMYKPDAQSAKYKTSDFRVIEETVASDHRPLVVDVDF